MAVTSFKTQITDLAGSVGSASDDTLQQWMIDGCYDVIDKLGGLANPMAFAIQSGVYTGPMTIALDNVRQFIGAERNGYACRQVPDSQRKFVDPDNSVGANSLYKAISDDPVYYILNNSATVKPNPSATELGYYSYIPEYSVSISGTVIDDFPNQFHGHVVLYTAMKTVSYLMNSMQDNTDITTALTAANNEIDECLTIADDIHTQTGNAITEITEAITLTDSTTSDIKTALTAVNYALDQFRTSGGDPAAFGDETTYTSGDGITKVKDALDKVQNLIDGTTMGGDTEVESAQYWLNDEDSEMVQATLSVANTEIARAQSHLAEWTAAVQTLQAEVSGYVSEAQARYGWIATKAQVWQGNLAAAQSYGQEIQSKVGIVQSYITEATTRLQVDAQKYAWYKDTYTTLLQQYISKFPNQGLQGGKE